MAERPRGRTGDTPDGQRTRIEHVAARALLEATTIDEAAAGILQSVCETLGWAHGAMWVVDRATETLRCARIWNPPSVHLPEFGKISRDDDVHARRRTARAGLGHRRAGVDSRRDARPQLPACPRRRPRAAARRLRLPDHRPRRSRERDGVLQPRDPAAGQRAALDAHGGRQSNRDVLRPAAGAGRAQSLLQSLARHAVRRRLRRLLQARQPGVAASPRVVGARAALAAVHRAHSSRRSRSDATRPSEASREGARSSISRTATSTRTARSAGCCGRRRRSLPSR